MACSAKHMSSVERRRKKGSSWENEIWHLVISWFSVPQPSRDIYCNNQSTHSPLLLLFMPYSCFCFAPFLSLPQVFRPYCQSIWRPGLYRQPSATSVVMKRASLCARTTTAGATVPQNTHSVIAPRWIYEPWKPVCWKSGTPGTQPTETLRSRVSVFFLCALAQWLWPSYW